MRKQHEDAPALDRLWTALDHADAGVAILDRRWKITRLKRRPHALIFARRDASVEHERFGPTADAAERRADDRLVRCRRRHSFPPNLALAGCRDPERARSLRWHPPILGRSGSAIQ